MTRQETIALVALASSSYPSMQARDPKPIVEAWSLMLADIDPLLAKAAIIKVCRESQFFPGVAQIVAAAAQLDPQNEPLPTAAEAWEEVMRLIRDCGPHRRPVYSCDTVKRAARAIGWLQLCMGENPEADRAHFLRLYESMRSTQRDRQENEKVLALSGMGGLVRALAGKLSR
jgi:hypothetical protein